MALRPLARALAVLVAAGGPVAASAQDVGRTVKGDIVAVALLESPRRLTVRLDGGAEVEALLAHDARVTFKRGVWRFGSPPHVSDLQPGMTVQFKWHPDGVDRLLVLQVPPDARPGAGYEQAAAPSWGGAGPATAYEAGREIRARVVDVNVAAGTLTVEVDGRPQAFLADPRDLRGLRKGVRVVLVTGEGGRLASVRPEKAETR